MIRYEINGIKVKVSNFMETHDKKSVIELPINIAC